MQDRESRPAPSPEEITAASTSPHGSWSAKQLREWGVPWPPPAGWRKELARKHAAGEEVVPLRSYGKPAESPAGVRDEKARAADPTAPGGTAPARVLVTDIGPVDPRDPPPWL